MPSSVTAEPIFLPLGEYARLVREQADGDLARGGEPPLSDAEFRGVAKAHAGRRPAAAVACGLVGDARQRRMGTLPLYQRGTYDPQECRAAEYICQAGVGAGMDPVGFLIASHAYLAHCRRQDLARAAAMEARLREVGIDLPEVPEKASRSLDAYARAFEGLGFMCVAEDTVYGAATASLLLTVSPPPGAASDPEAVRALRGRVDGAVREEDPALVGEVGIVLTGVADGPRSLRVSRAPLSACSQSRSSARTG